MQSRLPALYTFSLQYQMNRNNVSYVPYWIFGNFSLLNYPTITNSFAVDQIIRYNGVFAIRKTPLQRTIFSVPWPVRYSGIPRLYNRPCSSRMNPPPLNSYYNALKINSNQQMQTYFDPHWYSLFRGAVSIPVQLRQTQIWAPPPPRLCGSLTVL